MTYLLDSSAWLAHLFGEPGVDDVAHPFDEPGVRVGISALSILEVFARLKAIGRSTHWPEIWGAYSALFSDIFPADEVVALQAIQLRSTATARLPAIDALIAATALAQELILVHRDPHMGAIPDSVVRQMWLPDQ